MGKRNALFFVAFFLAESGDRECSLVVPFTLQTGRTILK